MIWTCMSCVLQEKEFTVATKFQSVVENWTLMPMYVQKPRNQLRTLFGLISKRLLVNTRCMFTITRSTRSDAQKTQPNSELWLTLAVI